MHYFLGLEVQKMAGKIFLTQGKYAIDILQRFGMQDCKSMSVPMTTNLTKLRDLTTSSQGMDSTLYRQLIGSLMYLIHTRPDICYTVNAPSQFMSNPKHIHQVADKHVLRYVRGTITYGLKYTSSSGVLLARYADSDWAGSAVDRKSTSGYCFNMGSTMISWSSKKQVLQHRVQLKQSILLQVMPARKQFGSGNYYLICSVESLTQRSSIAIISVALIFQRTRCFMTDRNTLK